MEQHIVFFNRLCDKEDIHCEQGDHIRVKKWSNQGVTKFQKEIESTLKARMNATTSLIIQHSYKILEKTK
jgi:hypothetical protein